MNLLHRALLAQQCNHSKHTICPACELPAIFTLSSQDDQAELWVCSNCQEEMALSELWPIAPLARESASVTQQRTLAYLWQKEYQQPHLVRTV